MLHRLGLRQVHAIGGQLGRQLAAKAVAGQWVEVLGAHALAGQCAAQVVERAAQARQVAAIGAADQVDERLARDGDLDGNLNGRRLVGSRDSHGGDGKAGNKNGNH